MYISCTQGDVLESTVLMYICCTQGDILVSTVLMCVCCTQGDVLVSVNGVKVVNNKQATRLITKSADRLLFKH